MTRPLTTTVSGTVTSATTASSGEIHSIIPTTPSTVSSEVSSWLSVCCSVWLRLSMSLVTRLSSSPRGCWSVYASGSRWSLAATSSRSRKTVRCTASLSRNACSQREHRRGEVDREREQQDPAEVAGVDALPGDEVEPRQQPGAVLVAGGARLLDELLLRRAGRDLPAEQPGEDEVGGPAEQRRPEHRQPDADDAQRDDGEHAAALGAQPSDDPAGGRPEVDRALADHAAAERPAARPRSGRDPLGLLHAAALHGGHATPCTVSCEATISW